MGPVGRFKIKTFFNGATVMSIKEIRKIENRKAVWISILKILVLLIIVLGIPAYIYFFQDEWLSKFKTFEDVVQFLERYQRESIPIYLGLQILQIVVSVLPGQVFQLAAGYMYTFFPALILAVFGATVGTMISFFLARVLGRDFVHLFFGEEKTSYYMNRLNSKKAYVLVFLLYVIPGIPKDMVSYVAGVSDMKFKPFLILSVIGRLPGMMGSIMLGSMWHKEEYTGMIILGCVAIVAFILCIIFHKKINDYIDRIYKRISN